MNTIPNDADLHHLVLSVADALRGHDGVLGCAESCTGGWIAKLLTDIPGSSEWFNGGAVTYSNAAKHALLGVALTTLAQHGAVSRETAKEMVTGALARLDATVAVSVTGIAGPTGGSAGKPVGTVWIGWRRRGGAPQARVFHFSGDRDAVRRQTVAAALAGIQEILTR